MYIYSSTSRASLIQLDHTIQKGLDDACVDTVCHCSLKCHQNRLNFMSCIKINTLVILSRRKTNIIQVKGLMNKLCFVLLSRRKTSFYAKLQINCSLVYRFLHGCGLHYIVLSVRQEGLTTNYISVHYPG